MLAVASELFFFWGGGTHSVLKDIFPVSSSLVQAFIRLWELKAYHPKKLTHNSPKYLEWNLA